MSVVRSSVADPHPPESAWFWSPGSGLSYVKIIAEILISKTIIIIRAGHNFRCPLISPLSVDPLINGTALIFHCGNVNLTEEPLFLNLFMALALKILFCRIF
jgi:hypothetical protein